MNRVTNRAWIVVLFILILVGGMGFFLTEYVMESENWVNFTGSPHVYSKSNLGTGLVYDRNGELLMDNSDGRVYASDSQLRKATVHWLGDRQGNISAAALANYAGAMAGFDVVNGIYSDTEEMGRATLTISASVQKTALDALGDRRGTVAVYNYKTGEILCAVTSPTYDPDNVPKFDPNNPGVYEGVYLNRFLQSTYTPGSIFKLVATAAALDCVDGIEDMTFTCTGVYEFGIDKVTCESRHGSLNLRGALASSCNCSFAQIAQLIGADNMQRYVKRFGVVDSLTVDHVTTAAGNYDLSDAAAVELAWSCIGQYTDLINPAAFLKFVGAIAGGGEGAKPYIVSKITAGEETTYRAETEMGDRIISKAVAQTLTEYMRNNVKSIYGDWNFGGLSVCAKSGTSQQGGDKASNAMFAGFVQDEDYPLAFIVVVEGGGYGSSTCVPILSRVLNACRTVLDGE